MNRLLLFFLFLPLFAFSQNSPKDTIRIPEVNIIEKRIKTYGFKQTVLSQKELENFASYSLSEILQQAAGINIKTYGKGGLASSSIRGASASNTQILWNGVVLNSPMLGQFNLADLSAGSFDEIRILHGGSALLQNSGALGGTIMLRNIPDWKHKLEFRLSQNLGSLYERYTSALFKITNKQFHSQTRINSSGLYHSDIAREFRFTTFQNTEFQENIYFHNSYSQLNGHLEYKKIRQKLPGYIENNELVNNDLYIASVDFKHFWDKLLLKLNSSVYYNSYIYQNKVAQINSTNQIWSQQNNLELSYSFRDDKTITIGANTQNNYVLTNNYEFNPNEFTPSIFAAVNWNILQRINIFVIDKLAFYNREILPNQPSVGIDWQMNAQNSWHTKISAAKNYRRPTLNDRYWKPGGNPDLKPENGYSFEIGQLIEKTELKSELSFFYSVLNNRIIWLPEKANFWQATNFDRVISRGFEFFIKKSLKFQHLKLINTINYTFTHSYSLQANQKEIIPFIAPHQLSFTNLAKIKGWMLFINYSFTSKRNISKSAFLNPLYILNLKISKKINYKKIKTEINLRLDNALNLKTETMPGYYIEPRNLNILLRFTYSKNR